MDSAWPDQPQRYPRHAVAFTSRRDCLICYHPAGLYPSLLGAGHGPSSRMRFSFLSARRILPRRGDIVPPERPSSS